MSDQDSLTIFGKKHQVSFPVARLAPFVDVGRAPMNPRAPDAIDHLATSASTPTALALAPGKVMAPVVVFGLANLGVDKPIDRFVAYHLTSFFRVQSSGHLGGRPAIPEPFENFILELGLTQQSTPSPAAAFRLLFCVGWLITDLCATVALKFTRYSRWRGSIIAAIWRTVFPACLSRESAQRSSSESCS